jgi:hypothetical protein
MGIIKWTRFTCGLPTIPKRSDYGLSCRWANASTKVVLATFLLLLSHCAVGQRSTWIATWATSPEAAETDPDEALLNLNNQRYVNAFASPWAALKYGFGSPMNTAAHPFKQIKQIGRITYTNTRPRDYWHEHGYDYYSGL